MHSSGKRGVVCVSRTAFCRWQKLPTKLIYSETDKLFGGFGSRQLRRETMQEIKGLIKPDQIRFVHVSTNKNESVLKQVIKSSFNSYLFHKHDYKTQQVTNITFVTIQA